ncbi:DUF6220 domain-containing protein [Actinoplanes sp. NPDC048988]|uniref:DUF6220 domain-containing protein n=1 Tax=Actinoplanes sp. NPDC048988 TaxID=3363901 RepID=UPI00371096EF
MRKTFTFLAAALLLIVIAQFVFATTGGFHASSYRLHHAMGYVIFFVPLIMAIVAAAGRLPARLVWVSLLVVGLDSLQVVIAEIGGSWTALHGLNGLAILASSGWLLKSAAPRGTPHAGRKSDSVAPR